MQNTRAMVFAVLVGVELGVSGMGSNLARMRLGPSGERRERRRKAWCELGYADHGVPDDACAPALASRRLSRCRASWELPS
jgi:hypothetical protein